MTSCPQNLKSVGMYGVISFYDAYHTYICTYTYVVAYAYIIIHINIHSKHTENFFANLVDNLDYTIPVSPSIQKSP